MSEGKCEEGFKKNATTFNNWYAWSNTLNIENVKVIRKIYAFLCIRIRFANE